MKVLSWERKIKVSQMNSIQLNFKKNDSNSRTACACEHIETTPSVRVESAGDWVFQEQSLAD